MSTPSEWYSVQERLPGIGVLVILFEKDGTASCTKLVNGSNHAPPLPGLYWKYRPVDVTDRWCYPPEGCGP